MATDTKEFRPAIGCTNRHLQTLLPVMFNSWRQIDYVREECQLPDDDFVDLDWTTQPETLTRKPIVIIFHGLEGSSRSHYAKSMMRAIHQSGWHGVVMHFRGCSGRLNKQARLYHSGETGDAAYVIKLLHDRYPQAPLFAIGYSLGGNMLLKLSGEQGNNCQLQALVAVSAPVKLSESTLHMINGNGKFYDNYMLKSLKQKILNKYTQHDYIKLLNISNDHISRCRNLREFDDCFTAPLHGFQDASDYYQQSSAFDYINKIRKPCLILHAQDDPVAPASALPRHETLSKNITLEITRHGGHAGFVSGWPWKHDNWAANRIIRFLSGQQGADDIN